jgi:hypothetical protein
MKIYIYIHTLCRLVVFLSPLAPPFSCRWLRPWLLSVSRGGVGEAKCVEKIDESHGDNR